MVQFLLKLLLKQIILAVCHDFHCMLVATKLLALDSQTSLKLCQVKESESKILERPESVSESEILKRSELESGVLPPTPQPWFIYSKA